MTESRLRLSTLPRHSPHDVHWQANADDCADISAALGLLGLRKLRLTGTLAADTGRDWRFEGMLGATATQACTVTLDPVTTRIDTPVLRRYVADLPDISADEMETPEDDSEEPLPASLDLLALATEALAIALPDYPRAPGAEAAVNAEAAPPGAAPFDAPAANPFAALAALKDDQAPD